MVYLVSYSNRNSYEASSVQSSCSSGSIYIQEDVLDKFYPYMHRHEEYQLIWIKEGVG